jgi:hypothetical protein
MKIKMEKILDLGPMARVRFLVHDFFAIWAEVEKANRRISNVECPMQK